MSNYADTSNIVAGRKIYAADVKTPIDALDTALASYANGSTAFTGFLLNGALKSGAVNALTISSGTITVSKFYHTVTTEGGASTDDLDSIVLPPAPTCCLIQLSDASKQVVVRHNVGNIMTATGESYTLSSTSEIALFISNGTKWYVGSYNNNHTHTPSQIFNLQDTIDARVIALNNNAVSLSVADDITVTAGEELSPRDYVYVSPADGKAYRVDIDAATPTFSAVRGFVVQAGGIAQNATGAVRLRGMVTGFSSGLTEFTDVYASSTPGSYTTTRPDPSSGGGQMMVLQIGWALNATTIYVEPHVVKYIRQDTVVNGGTVAITHHAETREYGRRARAFYFSSTSAPAATSYDSANADSTVQLRGVSGAGASTTVYSNGTTIDLNLGNDGTNDQQDAQSFRVGTSGLFSQFTLSFSASVASPAGTITWEIRTDDGASPSFPTSTVLETGTFTPTPSSVNTITASGTTFLDSGITYWIVLKSTTPQSVGKRWMIKGATTAGSGMAALTTAYKGTYRYGDGGAWVQWSSNGLDLVMSVTTSAVTTKDKLAQSFQIQADATIKKTRLYMAKVGSPTGTMTLRIETDAAGAPSGNLANANATTTVAESTLATSAGWIDFTFSSSFSLTINTTYWLVLSTDRAASNTNYITWSSDASAPGYTYGAMYKYASSAWSAESKDAVFSINPIDISVEEALVVGRFSVGTRDVGVQYGDGSGGNTSTKVTFKNVTGGSLDMISVVEFD